MQWEELNRLGTRLSIELNCPVRWPGYDKNVFACRHDIVFPLYRLVGSDDWSWVREYHKSMLRSIV